MSSYNTDKIKQILIDTDKKGNDRPWKDKKIKSLQLADSYFRLGFKKCYRVAECSDFLVFKELPGEKKLHEANFCRVRLCPMCSWRRSLKIFGQTSKIMDEALKEKKYRFIFLTLTVKNVYGDELPPLLDDMFNAFHKMFRRKVIKNSIVGWFRALEVTHNIDVNSKDFDTYHPHFHIILMVNLNYFKKQGLYISQEKWTSLWQESMKLDYKPIVDVRSFKSNSKAETSKSVSEASKYAVKDNDFLIDNNMELTDASVLILDKALAYRRLVAYGGKLKEIHKRLNLDDPEEGNLIHTCDEESLRDDVNYIYVTYAWHVGFRQYVCFK